tara:strand:- start:2471 stop:4111 length:1641 start_codon:yes stop_codon:yes gene_type:complete
MARTGGENLQQEFNRGYDYIINTYGAATNTVPGIDNNPILSKGIVVDIDFDTQKNYKLAAAQPPFSIYAKIIGEDLDISDPRLEAQKIYYAPLFSIHNIAVPEIGEEILIMREGMNPSSKGYYIGRISNCSALNYYPVRQYMETINSPNSSPEFKYGFSFNAQQLRENKTDLMPSDQIESISIPMTYGDVVQQGRSQSYVRHSFNRNNKKGVLEQGLRVQGQNIRTNISNTVKIKDETSYDPSIGHTATKTIHFVDSSIKRLGDFNLASIFADNPSQGILDGNPDNDKPIIATLADEIYNISTKNNASTLYRQVLGEKLISHQQETNNLMRSMLDGLTGLAETVQVLLDAFVEHEHALPKIELNLEKEIKSKDLYRTSPRQIKQPDQFVRIPGKRIRIQTGTKYVEPPGNEYAKAMGMGVPPVPVPIYSYTNTPSSVIRVKQPPRIIPGRIRARNVKQKINFEAIIGGEENPRFTAPIQTDTDSPESMPLPGAPEGNIEKTELGMKTAQINTDTENLIDKFNNQKEQLSNIFNKATDFLSRNQFIN